MKSVIMQLPSVDEKEVFSRLISGSISTSGFPRDFKVQRCDYEETTACYYMLCTSDEFPETPSYNNIPIVKPELIEGDEDIVKFNINYRI